MEGQARLLFRTMVEEGLAELLKLKFLYFAEVGLLTETDDRTIWFLAQENEWLILTNNRNNDSETSLTATINKENALSSLPVITIGDAQRLDESEYRNNAAYKLGEILLDLENYRGTGRIFIP
jgi:hypothetical protein